MAYILYYIIRLENGEGFMKTKKMTFLSLMVAYSLVLYIIETYIPNPLIAVFPGAKLGLSNIITLISLIILGIKDTFIINKKNTLRTNKYIIISELEPKNITRISKRRFQTDKSLYLDSLLYSASLGYSNNSYLIVKRKIAELHLEKMHKSIINDEIESKDSDIKIIFRTIMLLFSNEEYKVVIDKITNNKNILNIYLNYFGQDIIKIIDNDRQRHKTLSLRK